MPKNLKVIDVVPKNEAVIDITPKNMAIDPQTLTRNYLVNIGAGQPIGLLLTLTYPTAISNILQWGDSGGVTP